MRLEVHLYQDEDGVWIAEIPSLPGCVSDGQTREEAIKNVDEAARACLAVRHDLGLPGPVEIRYLEIAG